MIFDVVIVIVIVIASQSEPTGDLNNRLNAKTSLASPYPILLCES